MLKILTKQNKADPVFDEMFRGRAQVFHERLHWKVAVRDGREIDHYDEFEEPVYLISVSPSAQVLGSLRLLPTTGPTMLRGEFGAMFQHSVDVESPTAWECTRFCVHPPTKDNPFQSRGVALELLSGLSNLAVKSGIESIVGVYEAPMVRVYRRLGWVPSPLSASLPQFGELYCGLWDVTPATNHALRLRLEKLAPRSPDLPSTDPRTSKHRCGDN